MIARFLTGLLLLASAAASLSANVRLPALISDHMLLERRMPDRIWGWADAGEAVSVSFRGQEVSTKADSAGKWEVFLMPMEAGPAADMTVKGNNQLMIHDVLVGEVWVGSGQSNMALPLLRAANPEEETAQADYPEIRLFQVKRAEEERPVDDVQGEWMLCSPQSVPHFSAVGYFFARALYRDLHVPIGFIHSSVGGTPVEAWTRHEALAAEPAVHVVFDEWQRNLEEYPAAKAQYDKEMADWRPKADAAKASGTPVPPQPRAPLGPGHTSTPSGLYNGMIAPLVPYTIRGVIWYQGENNARDTEHALLYRRLFPLMIEDWRRLWGEGEFPFLFVQLANYQPPNPAANWPLLRESQTMALALRNTGMAVTIDIGNSTNIHPTNKQEVGRRLALWARAMTYDEKIESSGPLYRECTRDGSALRLWFNHAEGLGARDAGKLNGFRIAGEDRKFVPAEAYVDRGTVVVKNLEVPDPTAVRYAWDADPAANLVNSSGLPASPFRTDTWAQ